MDDQIAIRYMSSWILLCISFNVANGQTSTDINKLYTDIFTSYQKSVVPNSDFSTALNVKLRMYLMTISRFNEVEETLDTATGMIATWTDSGFTWDPSSYGNAEYIIVPHTDVWTPKFVLTNSVETYEPIGGGNDLFVTINYNGSVSIAYGDVMSSKCTANVYKFPFDSQTCYLNFVVWGIAASDINLIADSIPVDLSFYTPNSDWSLESYKGETLLWNGYSNFKMTFTIKRAPLYYNIVVACPTLLFSILNPLVFLLSVDSGDRIGLSTTILLSYAIFLTMVQMAVPASSNPMSLLLVMMIVTITVSGICVGVTIYISSLYHRDPESKMNKVYKFIGSKTPWRQRLSAIRPASYDIEIVHVKSATEVTITWKDVCDGLDKYMMWLSYLMVFIVNVTYFIVSSV
ncbi:acetylcholine receptor subunit alpha-1-B-like [Mytilus edulis]|uniref:acetylcholine receptor subunit alpha-1-B-like n=1 Tax=Mytilus edulis TaxID=6550 RepID=UPI0039EDE866